MKICNLATNFIYNKESNMKCDLLTTGGGDFKEIPRHQY